MNENEAARPRQENAPKTDTERLSHHAPPVKPRRGCEDPSLRRFLGSMFLWLEMLRDRRPRR